MSGGSWVDDCELELPLTRGELVSFETYYVVNLAYPVKETVSGEVHQCPGRECAFCLWRKNHTVRNHAS